MLVALRLSHAAVRPAARAAPQQRIACGTNVTAGLSSIAAAAAVASSASVSSARLRGVLSLSLPLRRGFASNNRGNRGTIATASVVVDNHAAPATTATRGAKLADAGAVAASSSSSVPYLRASSTTISDVLSVYQADGRTFTCSASASLAEAVRIMVSSRVGCLVAMEEDGEHVAGLVTERDILSEMVRLQDGADETSCNWSTTPVSSAMTRSREMVHIRPGDLIDDALKLMTSQGFRHLPVLESTPEGNHLRGMVSMRNLVDVIYKHKDAGGKAQFLYDILPRTGVPKNTALRKKGHAAPPGSSSATGGAASSAKDADAPYPSLFLNAGICAIPHPDKKAGEDSYVAVVANLNGAPQAGGAAAASPTSSSSSSSSPLAPLTCPFSVLAVFDGVGSWSFEQGLDPAKFSAACAEGLKAYIDGHPTLSPAPTPASGVASQTAASLLQSAPTPLSPSCMLNAVWDFVCQRRVVGSSTACILALAHHTNELRAANIGDSGFLVLRHRDALRQLHMGSVGATTPAQTAGTPVPDYQVVYRSPQQLHYFNCPLQIGIDTTGAIDKFESPVDADLLSVPLQDGDLIVLATDGLFDNVPEEAIVAEVGRSMDKIAGGALQVPVPASSTSGSADRPALHTGPISPLTPVATALAHLAHRLSLDKFTDSPFAVLAKDNNILWKNGGRKDDITVIVARVDTIATSTDLKARA